MSTQISGTAVTATTVTASGAVSGATVEATTVTQGAVAMPRMVLATAQATTSGTSIDFTGIPSWVKRITIVLEGVSTNGNSYPLIQIGSGSILTSGYRSAVSQIQGAGVAGTYSSTAGFVLFGAPSIYAADGVITLNHKGSNVWVEEGVVIQTVPNVNPSAGFNVLGGTLDRLRLTTVNGTDTFDAGSVNILYEG